MAGLERRLERLEAESLTAVDEDAWKQLWFNAKRGKRVREHRNPDESHAHGIFKVMRLQKRLATTREEVEDQLLSWRLRQARWLQGAWWLERYTTRRRVPRTWCVLPSGESPSPQARSSERNMSPCPMRR